MPNYKMEVGTEPQWVVLLAHLIAGPELSQNDFTEKEAALVSEIKASGESILQILRPLGQYLTTESDTPRSKAVVLLAKVRCDQAKFSQFPFNSLPPLPVIRSFTMCQRRCAPPATSIISQSSSLLGCVTGKYPSENSHAQLIQPS